MDRSVRVRSDHLPAIGEKRVRPTPYSRERMFAAMARQRIAIFRGVGVLLRGEKRAGLGPRLLQALHQSFPPRERARVQVGPRHLVRQLGVRDVLERWARGRSMVGVTDLHIRDTRLEPMLDLRPLTEWNGLVRGSEDLARQEMMTFVIASRGNVTDSHSDDPDGTNHCFVGRKLWLAWDTFEGLAHGLEDVERVSTGDQARFSMDRFLRLRSSRWFVVAPGDTLFLPGRFTHKVFTLEPYLGLGSFNLSLPNSLAALSRWVYRRPLWSLADPEGENAGLVEEAATVMLRLATRARAASARIRRRWGADYLGIAYRAWRRRSSEAERQAAAACAPVRGLLDVARHEAGLAG
jgi:hypothetical protein